MLLGREKELQYLNTAYQSPQSRIIVVYGQKNVGKSTLIREFCMDKNSFYFTASPASTRQHRYLIGKKLSNIVSVISEYPEYDEIFTAIQASDADNAKKVIVFDEWEHLIKSDTEFMDAVVKNLQHEYSKSDALIILVSSSIGFTENALVSRIGSAALNISGFLKIKELKFVDLIQYFNDYSIEDCIKTYSVLGGFPGLWNCFDKKLSPEENICSHIINRKGILSDDGGKIVKEELRETSVYCTILSALAQGKTKLNELYSHTGFSRAKISVYLKNLMELELVEKVFSIDTPGRDNQKKGVYRISNTFVHFWFKYIYLNYDATVELGAKAFYKKRVLPDFSQYCDEYFAKICREYMSLLASQSTLPFIPEKFGLFDGKEGKIDYIGQGKNGKTIVAFSYYSKPIITHDDYKTILSVLKKARITPEQIYIFSAGGFDEKLRLESKIKKNIILIEMEDL